VKRITRLVCILLALIIGISPVSVMASASPREGYTLVPTLQGISGVDTRSEFILTTPNDIVPVITIDNQPQPHVRRESANTFVVTPAATLSYNGLYIFRLSRDGLTDITWAFQTTVRFEVFSVFPRNEAVNVPVNTGIEVVFSASGFAGIEEAFEIYPHVEGRFEFRDNAAIFMPLNPLAHRQLYTITVRAGVELPGTTEAISEDLEFSFETAPAPVRVDSNVPVRPIASRVHFSGLYVELPSFEPPRIHFRLTYARGTARPVINMNVYRFDCREEAIAATEQLMTTPRWTRYTWMDRLINTADLTRVESFTITEQQGTDRWTEIMELPDSLPPGFYLVSATTDGNRDQMVIQITDLAVQVVSDSGQAIVWVNDMTTGRPAAGANVLRHDREYVTDAHGIAILDGHLPEVRGDRILITAADGKEHVVFFRFAWRPGEMRERYWTVLQLDRTLFQRDDTLNLWGFVQNRRIEEDIEYVTAVITHAWGGWGWGGRRDILHRQVVPVVYGVYSAEMNLPRLDPGSYNLTVFHGDISIGSIFFTVEDFVKPPYQMFARAQQRAVFAGESADFTVRTEFFEGTPVAGLNISYRLSGTQLQSFPSGQGVTNIDGELEINTAAILPGTHAQGQTTLTMHANATLPEIGWVQRSASVRVFINDISMRARAVRNGANASISIDVNDITLERLNNSTARNSGDFLCEPVDGQEISVVIRRVYWERVRDGERYDHIARRVIPIYRHERREEVLHRFDLITDENGQVSQEFRVPDRQNESYLAEITTIDGNGRTITQRIFIGRDFTSFHLYANENQLFLYGARPWSDGYNIGDEVVLTLKRGAEAVTLGNFLFVVVQQGILHYHVGSNPFVFNFDEKHLPNVAVYAFYFNGHTYHTDSRMRRTLRFNSQSRNLVLTAEACQETYRPGDMATIRITATDNDGNPKQANINISVVDEALFALRDYRVNTLTALYATVGAWLPFSMSTHRTFVSDGLPVDMMEDMLMAEAQADGFDSVGMAAPAAAPAPAPGMAAEPADETHLREVFEDTAIFAALRTNELGEATFTFRLPDNITSWRMTVSGLSNDLYAGNVVEPIVVTQPMFLHYSLNSVFLTGDIPTLGLNIYGTALSGGEAVTIQVWDESTPEVVLRATGSVFERINIPLWEMDREGEQNLIIYATAGGLSDAVRHPFHVVETHRQIDTSTFYDVVPGMAFTTNPTGLTNITFSDRGRGQVLNQLFGMRRIRHSRIEEFVLRREAERLLAEHFPEIPLWNTIQHRFNPQNFQQRDGGLSVLPHGASELEATVRLMPFVMDEINVNSLRDYLYRIFNGTSAHNKITALYGLAMLQEPVLLDLQNYAMLEDLAIRDIAYIALGFAALGERATAIDMYNNRILPHIQRIAPYYRVYTGATRAELLQATAAVSLLAVTLGMSQSEGLYRYIARHHTNDLLVNLARLSFISHEIENINLEPASITYTLFGRETTRHLGWNSFTLRIPVQNLHEFEIISTTGAPGAVSIHREPLTEQGIANIAITREFFRSGETVSTTEFEQGDLVRVQLTIDYSALSLHGSYTVTDFLPAGLVVVPNSARFGTRHTNPGQFRHVKTEGQRVTFFDHNGNFDDVRVYYYYARVINPGVFLAEGPMVQSVGAREYFVVGEDEIMVIQS